MTTQYAVITAHEITETPEVLLCIVTENNMRYSLDSDGIADCLVLDDNDQELWSTAHKAF